MVPIRLSFVHIDEATEEVGRGEDKYDAWRLAANAKIGYGGKTYLFAGLPDNGWDFAWVAGGLYKRCLRNDGPGFFFREQLDEEDDEETVEDTPDILCECGGAVFELRYGSYEISARCPTCQIDQVVYDG